MKTYRVEHAGTLAGSEDFWALHDAEHAASERARRTGRLQLVWSRDAKMYVARVYPSRY